MTLQPGQIVNNYRLDQTIHRGRATIVFAATDMSLQRRVAFKVLTEDYAADPGVRERFAREAQIAAALDGHPHIVTVYTWGQVDNSLYFVTEFIAGISLAELVERQPGGEGLPVSEALELLAQAADAVDFAHRHGAVHHDIKPANIMVKMTETPRSAYLVDFGITKVADAAGDFGDGTGANPAGPRGSFVGTLAYASPEQITGQAIDHRTDVYSFAATAYEILCGRSPFGDEPDETSLAMAHLQKVPPDITVFRSTLPPGLNEVFRRGLAKRPEDRFATCTEFVQALRAQVPDSAQAYARPLPPGADVPPPSLEAPDAKPPRRWPIVVVLAALVLILGAVGWIVSDRWRNPSVDVAIGRNVALPTTTTTTTTTTTSTTTTTTTTTTTVPPPPTNVFGNVIGEPVTEATSAAATYALAVQSRVFNPTEIAQPNSRAHYYAEWARLMGPSAEEAGPVTATADGFQLDVGTEVELRDFETDVEGRVMSFSECIDGVCHALDNPTEGLVLHSQCAIGEEGCMTVGSADGQFTMWKVMDVALRMPARSALYRIEWVEPPGTGGTGPTDPPPPRPTITNIFNSPGTGRYIAGGDYFVLTFDAEPQSGSIDTFTVTYADNTTTQVVFTYP